MNLCRYIDHTILKPLTTLQDIENLCKEAAAYQFAAVCVPPPFVRRAKALLSPTDIKVATVIGFPFGYAASEAKLAETLLAVVDGADEVDMVINLIALKMNDLDFVVREVKLIAEVVHKKNKLVKVIIESGMLSNEEIIACCRTIGQAGINYMKTSTGYAEKGASVFSVQLMREHLPSEVKIKASGGIKTYAFAKELVEAGAERLGCSSSVAIVTGEPGFGSGY